MKLEVTPSFARIDEMLSIRVSGCPPLTTVRVTARMGEGNWEWTSYADFVAGSDGTVDLSASAPIAGSYDGCDPMGLIWSMELCARGQEKLRRGDFKRSAREVRPKRIFQAERAGTSTNAVTNIAYYARAPVTYTPVREQGIVASMFHRAGIQRPGMVVLGGSDGGIAGFQAALLAEHGYTVLAPAYFRKEGLPQELKEIPFEYFEKAILWLRSHPDVLGDCIGVIGFSRGGELALLLGSTFPEIRAVVSFVGSGVVVGALTREPDAPPSPAWTWRGKAIEPLSIDEMNQAGADCERGLDWFKGNPAIQKASIPVEKTKGPILLISGEEDALWSSTPLSEIAVDRLRRSGFPFPYEHLVYRGAGHAISPPYHPTTLNWGFHPVSKQLYSLGGDPRSNAHACADSWTRVLSFLRRRLGES